MKYFRYKNKYSREISFPLGGIGTGCIGLGGSGHLVDWEIFNRPAKGSRNGFTHFALKAERRGEVLDARVMHGDVQPPYIDPATEKFTDHGTPRQTLSGFPHFRHSEFLGGFPFAKMNFKDEKFPGKVSLTAFNPFIPHNDIDSSIPAAFFEVSIRNTSPAPIEYTIAFSVRNPAPGRTSNKWLRMAWGNLLWMDNDAPDDGLERADFAAGTDCADVNVQEYWYRGRWFDNPAVFWREFSSPGRLKSRSYDERGGGDHGTLAAKVKVPPGGEGTARFVFSWNVPNCRNYWKPEKDCGSGRTGEETVTWKNYYATVFKNAVSSASYCLRNWERLKKHTALFRDALFRSSLPAPVLEAVSANLSILKSPTCLRLEDGSFYGWEGCNPSGGCCEGSCSHVWNYSYALPFLFPNLERGMRELDYRYNQRDDGGMCFRLQLPPGRELPPFKACADGQFGGVLKVYREWKISGDTGWLRRLWPAVRRAVEFAWAGTNENLWDPGKSGVLRGRQHHTLDADLFGPNAWLTGFYLAALKAAAEMARACGEKAAGDEYSAVFKRGRRWVESHLFNGDYFIQKINLRGRNVLSPFEKDNSVSRVYWSPEHCELKYQAGDGCGIDQVVCQWHADIAGLGEVLARKQVLSALRAVYRNNFRSSMRNVFNPCRLFSLDDESGTMMFSWPSPAEKPAFPILYAEETMSGFEYQFAGHLVINGMPDKGLRVVKAVRARYDGFRRNPWNEIECGSNYARSMASYALLNAYSGLRFDMTRGELGFHPPESTRGFFRCFWSLCSGWGEVEIKAGGASLRVKGGKLRIKRLSLDFAAGEKDIEVTRKGGGAAFSFDGEFIDFGKYLELRAGETLKIKSRIKNWT